MTKADKILRYKSIAFQLMAIKAPQARYRFISSGKNFRDFFSMPGDMLQFYGFKKEDIRKLKKEFPLVAEEEIKKAEKNSVDIIFFNDPDYPPLLKEIFDPPSVLYVMGDRSTLSGEKKLAVVGSRKGDSYGKSVLNSVLPPVVRAGVPVVSGMAYGIDAMAHSIALKEGGKTIGVNAGGLLHLYPAGNRGLADEICRGGCIVSEFPLETVPRPFLFPIRNRIIAGLSNAVMLVQAEMRSGSLITARLGMEQNREILSVPGKITDPLSAGTNYLIRQGAKPVISSRDILEEFGLEESSREGEDLSDISIAEKKFLDLMSINEVKSIDYFVETLRSPVSEVLTVLMGLVLKSIVIEDKGGFRRIR